MFRRLAATIVVLTLGAIASPVARQNPPVLASPLEAYLEPLRVQAGIPGVVEHDHLRSRHRRRVGTGREKPLATPSGHR